MKVLQLHGALQANFDKFNNLEVIMKKSIFRALLLTLFGFLFSVSNSIDARTLALVVEIPSYINTDGITNYLKYGLSKGRNKIKGIEKITNLNNKQKRYNQVNITPQDKLHLTIAIIGSFNDTRQGNRITKYSNKIKDCNGVTHKVSDVEKAINKALQEYKKYQDTNRHMRPIRLNVATGARFLYNQNQPSKAKVAIVQDVHGAKNGPSKALDFLVQKLKDELTKIGVNFTYNNFVPHVTIANAESNTPAGLATIKRDANKQSCDLVNLFKSVQPITKSFTNKPGFKRQAGKTAVRNKKSFNPRTGQITINEIILSKNFAMTNKRTYSLIN